MLKSSVFTDNTSEQAVRDFKTELKILKEVNVESHKNIVRLIGACTLEGKEILTFFSALIEGG